MKIKLVLCVPFLLIFGLQTASAQVLTDQAEISVLDEYLFDSFEVRESNKEANKKFCKAIAKTFCSTYCEHFQDEYSYETCMNGVLFWDGCVDKVTKRCVKFKKKVDQQK